LGGKTILQKKRILGIFIVFLLCFSFINQILVINVLAEENKATEPKGILQILGKIYAKNLGRIMRAATPETAVADPHIIEISYNETVIVGVGIWNITSNDFQLFDHPKSLQLWEQRFLSFEAVEFPGGNEYGKWLVTFDPPNIKVVEGTKLKTNAIITLRSPRLADKPVQSGILKIRFYDKWANGNIYWPRKGNPSDQRIVRGYWFFSSIVFKWGKELSGKTVINTYDVNILVKVKPYHSVNFYSVPYLIFKPDEIVSIPITLQNLGNYNDTYGFRIAGEQKDIRITQPPSITLAPGETRNTYLGVTLPPSIFDYGTIHNIKIEAYSIDQENVTIAERTVSLESRGVYVSELNSLGIIFIIFVLILSILFIMNRRKHLFDKICIKPDKPWEIPEEKKYLENLKQKDKQEYDEVFKMMEDEYNSALLWYNSYIKSIIQQKPVKKEKIKTKKPEKKKIEKQEDIKLKEEQIKIEQKEKIEKQRELDQKKKEQKIIDEKIRTEKLKKEQTLQKIKHDQDKQRKKITKSIT
jgi:hypothetical protein